MNYFLIRLGIIFLGVAVLSSPLEAKKKKGEDLSNMIIEGENRLRVEPKEPAVPWYPKIYRDVRAVLGDYAFLGELRPPTIKEPPVVVPRWSRTGKTASPWLEQIFKPPVLTLKLKLPKDFKSAEWAFLIKDSHGNTFYEKKGKKTLEKILVWDGFSQRKKPLHMGSDYAYTFSATDEGGNPHRFSGKPFRIDAFQYERFGNLIVHFWPEKLFTGRSAVKLSKTGKIYLTEIKDSIRILYGKKIEVVVYEEDTKFATFRAQTIRDYLQKALDWDEDKITFKGLPLSKGSGTRYVEIKVK